MAKELRRRFLSRIKPRWFTPDTYDKNFKAPIEAPGVYAITVCFHNLHRFTDEQLVYVGSSLNISLRHKSHQVFRRLREMYDNPIIRFYFLPMGKGFYDYERKLIQKLRPPMNKNLYDNATKNTKGLD